MLYLHKCKYDVFISARFATSEAFLICLHSGNILDRVEYKEGTVHQARVLSFKMVERVLIVATRKDILAQKMVCVKVRPFFHFFIALAYNFPTVF